MRGEPWSVRAPHDVQKRALADTAAPHDTQAWASRAPQLWQKRDPRGLTSLQRGQFTHSAYTERSTLLGSSDGSHAPATASREDAGPVLPRAHRPLALPFALRLPGCPRLSDLVLLSGRNRAAVQRARQHHHHQHRPRHARWPRDPWSKNGWPMATGVIAMRQLRPPPSTVTTCPGRPVL